MSRFQSVSQMSANSLEAVDEEHTIVRSTNGYILKHIKNLIPVEQHIKNLIPVEQHIKNLIPVKYLPRNFC